MPRGSILSAIVFNKISTYNLILDKIQDQVKCSTLEDVQNQHRAYDLKHRQYVVKIRYLYMFARFLRTDIKITKLMSNIGLNDKFQ